MKKFAAVMLSCLLIAAVLSGCGASMKDGTYRAEYDAYSHGYKEFVAVSYTHLDVYKRQHYRR